MIILHHLENSRSQRILWLLEELQVPYEIKKYTRHPKTKLAPPELAAIHPLGKSPVITDGDITVAESGAIIEYLVATYGDGSLKPSDGTANRQFTYWLHFAEGSFMPLMVLSLILHRIETAKLPFFAKPVAKGIAEKVRDGYVGPNVTRGIALVEEHLADNVWFCGDDFSAADIQMSFPLQAARGRAGLAKHPNIASFLERIESLPAYQSAIEKGGPFDPLGSS